MEKSAHAPFFEVEPRTIVAVEHPMIVKNLDNGVKTFGNNRPFQRIMDTEDPEECIPLYLRYNDPMCVPILSYHTPTNNVLLKITVPKRTGRKRKRGSQNQFIEADPEASYPTGSGQTPLMDNLRSHSRLDDPVQILRSLKDNKESYTVEAIGEIKVTHRYRGASDFHQTTSTSTFFPRFRDNILTGKVEEMRKFKFDTSMGWKPNEEFMPPPTMTLNPMHFNWAWQQNISIFEETDGVTGERTLVNRSAKRKGTNLVYIQSTVKDVPTSCPFELDDEPQLRGLVKRIQAAMEQRPIWTRRALLNHLGEQPDVGMIRPAIQYVGYQFKGGPFRDAVIRYGVDPRTDKSFRKYQTFFFKLYTESEKPIGTQWMDIRSSTFIKRMDSKPGRSAGHIFDGQTLTVDGKVWQVCDITEPLLANLMETAPYAPYDPNDGYFCNGTIAKIKAIMKTKLLAIRTQKVLVDDDFKKSLAIPDFIPDKPSRKISIPLPDVRLTNAEMEALRSKGEMRIVHNNGMRKRDSSALLRQQRIHRKMNDPASRMRVYHGTNRRTPRKEASQRLQEIAESNNGQGSQADIEMSNAGENDDGRENIREETMDGEDDDGLSILDDNTDDEDLETITDIEEDEISD